MNKDGYREVLSAAEAKAEHGQRQAQQGATGHGIRYAEYTDGPQRTAYPMAPTSATMGSFPACPQPSGYLRKYWAVSRRNAS